MVACLLLFTRAMLHAGGIPDYHLENKYIRELAVGVLLSPDRGSLSFRGLNGLHQEWSLTLPEGYRVQSFMADESRGLLAVLARQLNEPPTGSLLLYDLAARSLLFETPTVGRWLWLGSRYLVWHGLEGLLQVDLEDWPDLRVRGAPSWIGIDVNKTSLVGIEELSPSRFILGGKTESGGTLFSYDPVKHEVRVGATLSDAVVSSLRFDSEGHRLFAGDQSGALHVLLVTEQGLESVSTHQIAGSTLTDLAVGHDGRIFVATDQGEVFLLSSADLSVEASVRIAALVVNNARPEWSPVSYPGINTLIYVESERCLFISDTARNFYTVNVDTFELSPFSDPE